MKQALSHPLTMLLVAVGFGAVGQLLLKTGVDEVKSSAGSTLEFIRLAFTHLRVLGGFSLYGVSSVLWLLVLSKAELSYAYPMIAVGYIVVLVLSRVFLHEHVGWIRIAGVALICGGVVLIAQSGNEADGPPAQQTPSAAAASEGAL